MPSPPPPNPSSHHLLLRARRTATAASRAGHLVRDYNIAYSRKKYLKPLVDDPELRRMAELERLCFPPPDNHDFRTLRMFVSTNGAGLLRWRVPSAELPASNQSRIKRITPASSTGILPVTNDPTRANQTSLVAFHLFDCLSAELITLDVHPHFRRRGIGRALVSESMAKLREMGHERVRCQIAVSNESSLVLHRQLGFKVARLLQNYYGRNRHAFLLIAEL